MNQDSSVGIATRYGLDGPGIESQWGTRFSVPVQTALEAHILQCNGHRVSFKGVKPLRRGVDHPPPSSAEVKERVELYMCYPSGHLVCNRVNFNFLCMNGSFLGFQLRQVVECHLMRLLPEKVLLNSVGVKSWDRINAHNLICSLLDNNRTYINLLKTRRNLLYIRNQTVPRSKHFPPRL